MKRKRMSLDEFLTLLRKTPVAETVPGVASVAAYKLGMPHELWGSIVGTTDNRSGSNPTLRRKLL